MNTETNANLWRRRWLRFSVYTAIAIIILLIALPYAARYGLEQWLENNGADRAEIKDIDINLFTGTVALKGADVTLGGQKVISDKDIEVDLDLLPFFSRQATVRSATLDDLHLEIEIKPDGKVRIGSVVLGGGEAADAKTDKTEEGQRPWWFKVDTLQLTNSSVRYISPQLTSDVRLDRLVVKNLFTGPAETPADVRIDGEVDGAPISLTASGTLNLPAIKASGKLKVSGLDLNHYAGFLKDQLKELGGKTELDGQYSFSLTDGNLLAAGYDGKLYLSMANVATGDLESKLEKVSWQGKVNLATTEGGKQTIAVDGILGLSDPLVKIGDLRSDAGDINWKGKLDLALGNSGLQNIVTDSTLDLSAAKLATGGLQSNTDKLSWQGKVDLTSADDKKQNIKFNGALASTDLGINLPEHKLQAILSQVELRPAMDLQLNAGKLDGGGDVALHAENISLTLPQGVSHQGGVLDTSGKVQFSTTDAAGTQKFNWGAQVPTLTLTGDSVLRYSDTELVPPFNLELKFNKISINDIDSTDPKKAARFEISGEIGKYGKVESKGSARPFADKLFIDAETKLDNLSMVGISSYTIKSVGYYINSGQLDLRSKTVIENGTIDSQNELLMSKLKLKKAEGGLAAKTEADLGMPLDKALGLLRDKNDKIKLDVPVTGKLEEVDIGYNSVINIAMKKAIKAGAMSYLLFALQPYGSLVYLGEKIGEAAAKITLDPIEFEPGNATLTDKNKDYLQKIAKLMSDREEILVEVCS